MPCSQPGQHHGQRRQLRRSQVSCRTLCSSMYAARRNMKAEEQEWIITPYFTAYMAYLVPCCDMRSTQSATLYHAPNEGHNISLGKECSTAGIKQKCAAPVMHSILSIGQFHIPATITKCDGVKHQRAVWQIELMSKNVCLYVHTLMDMLLG